MEAAYAIDEDDCYDYDDNDNEDDGDDDDDDDDEDDDDDDDDKTTATTMLMMTTRTICSLHLYEVCPSDSDSWAESAGRIQPWHRHRNRAVLMQPCAAIRRNA